MAERSPSLGEPSAQPAAIDPPGTPERPWWGLGDAAVGWVIAYALAIVCSAVLASAFGYADDIEDAPLWFLALTYPPLWLGFVGVPIWAATTKGLGWVQDFKATIRWTDVPLGLAIGAAAQIVLVPLLSLPVLWLSGTDMDELSKPAQDLADKAVGPGSAILFILIVGLGAPIAEELFYRGLVLRSFEKRWGPGIALAATSLWFGASHFQALQLVALVGAGAVFGVLAQRSGRLGLAITAHMGFNLTTVVSLLWLT